MSCHFINLVTQNIRTFVRLFFHGKPSWITVVVVENHDMRVCSAWQCSKKRMLRFLWTIKTVIRKTMEKIPKL